MHFLPPYRADNKLKLSRWLGICPEAIADRISIYAIAIVSLRDKKSDEEIREIEDACEIGYRMHTTAMKMCCPGARERDIAGAIGASRSKWAKACRSTPSSRSTARRSITTATTVFSNRAVCCWWMQGREPDELLQRLYL